MRGDRPSDGSMSRHSRRATPHARGSTSFLLTGPALTGGYPACAGIDLGVVPVRRGHGGLPRMRGDRPPPLRAGLTAKPATPHARGSTHLRCRYRCNARGYPACAGIDLPPVSKKRTCVRLPRMRGDRPPLLQPLRGPGRATPHARGSTLPECPKNGNHHGYPACAGIDPKKAQVTRS